MTGKYPADLPEQVSRALREDIGTGDVTAQLISVDAVARGRVLCREAAVICGTAWFEETFRQLEPRIRVLWRAGDGVTVGPDTLLSEIEGPARAILTG